MYTPRLIRVLLCCLPLCTGLTQAQVAAQPAPVYRLNRLAAHLADGPAPLRADLARIAISELAAAYTDEAGRARRDRRHRSQQGDLWRWAAAVERLAANYTALAESITPDTPVQVSIGPSDSVYLIVAGRPVGVSSPRMREQAAFEQRVIARFCELNRCEDLLDEPDTPAAPATAYQPSTAQWSFSQQAGPVCGTGDGLEFQFQNTDNLERKRAVCAQVVAELNTLAAAIAHDQAGGIRVDWNTLAVRTLPDGDAQQVTLNGEGDYLQLSLPALAMRQDLLAIVRPWLAAKVNGQRYSLVVINAGQRLAAPGQVLE